MKKHFSELSEIVCSVPGCQRRLKQRIVDVKPSATMCYRCYQTSINPHYAKRQEAKRKEVAKRNHNQEGRKSKTLRNKRTVQL